MKKFAVAGCLTAAALMLQGCPPGEGPDPVFDATGTYAGTWSGQTSEDEPEKQQAVEDCPLTIALTQAVDQGFPANLGISGQVVIDYECIDIPERLPVPQTSTVNVFGAVNDQGEITLATGGCGLGVCTTLILQGQGEDLDEDGTMDTFSGEWAYSLLMPGVQPFTIAGELDVVHEDFDGEGEGEGDSEGETTS